MACGTLNGLRVASRLCSHSGMHLLNRIKMRKLDKAFINWMPDRTIRA